MSNKALKVTVLITRNHVTRNW